MKSDELIQLLKDMQDQYGVQEVYAEGQADSWPMEIHSLFRGYSLEGKVTSFRIEIGERPDWA